MHALLICSAAMFLSGRLPPVQPLWIELGPANHEHGLATPSGGDGGNVAEMLGGSPCRRISGPNSHYLYVQADAARVPPGCYDVYLAVEYYDDRTEAVRVEYDKAPLVRQTNSFYTLSQDLLLLFDSRQWRRTVIHLPDARFGHGQNFAADLRLAGSAVAVRRIELLFAPPPDYRPGGGEPAALEKVRTHIGPGMELDIGCDVEPGEAALFHAMGVTSIESYVTWQTVEDAGQGKWDWSRWDRQVAILRGAGLKWAPLVVVGPAYATPKWYRDSDRSLPYVCLEHGQPSKIQSLWNPQLRPWVDRFIKAFAERYRDQGIIELVRLGVTGIYGETLYPSGPTDGPIFAIPGLFHNHGGWWAGDPLAVASFRGYLRRRYADLAALNRAWAADYKAFDAIVPMLPEKAPSLRARLDFVDWYLQSMTDFTAFWAATVRKYFPATPIYMSLGGAGEPQYGADFSAQAKAIAPYHTRIRVTNEGSNYAQNFVVTREVVSACRAFGLDYGFEPAGRVSAEGNVARIYNATASGGIHLFCYKGNILQSSESLAAFRRYAPLLLRRTPRVDAALYLPKTSWILDGDCQRRVFAAAHDLRGRLDFEMLDPTTLSTPLAARVKVLAIPDAPYAEAAEIDGLQHWVAGGGILVVATSSERPLLRTPEASDAPSRALVPEVPQGVHLLRPTLRGQPPRRFRLELGSPHDDQYLWSQWYAPERGSMFPHDKLPSPAGKRGAGGVVAPTLLGKPVVPSTIPGMRWTGAKAGFFLPCDPAADATLLLTASLTQRSLPGTNRVLLNGVAIGVLDKSGARTYRFAVPRGLMASRSVAEVVLEVRAFCPRDFGTADNRQLGAAVAAVELAAKGAEHDPPTAVPLAWEFDPAQAARCVRRIGRGAVLAVACRGSGEFSEAVVQALLHPERLLPAGQQLLPSPLAGEGPGVRGRCGQNTKSFLDGRVGADAAPSRTLITAGDGLFATRLSDGVLYYNAGPQSRVVDGIEVPADGIAWRAAGH